METQHPSLLLLFEVLLLLLCLQVAAMLALILCGAIFLGLLSHPWNTDFFAPGDGFEREHPVMPAGGAQSKHV